MLSLSDLPTELLLAIFRFTSVPDCASIAAVSRQFCDVARVQLYRDIRLDWKAVEAPPVSKLLRTFVDNQDIRGLVKSLDLYGTGFTVPTVFTPIIPLHLDQDKASSLILGTHLPRPHVEAWERAFREGNLDAVVSLLVALLHNLVSLSILHNFARDNRLLSQTILHIAQSTTRDGLEKDFRPVLPKLSDVTIFHRPNPYHVRPFKNTPDILGWFYLPSIRRLRLSIDNPFEFTWPSPQPPRSQYLRYLALDQIRECRALPILAECPGLEELVWSIRHCYGPDADVIPNSPCINLRQVTEGLAPLRGFPGFKTLHIGAECFAGRLDLDGPPMKLLGFLDLASFTGITSLTVPWHLCLGMDLENGYKIGHPGTLPVNLTSLFFSPDIEYDPESDWDEPDVLATLREFLEKGRLLYTPHLRQFGVHTAFLEQQSKRELETLCEEMEISHSFVDAMERLLLSNRIPPLPYCWTRVPPTKHLKR